MREPVITPVPRGGAARTSRNLEERLIVRFPAIWQRLAWAALRVLRPEWRSRRSLLSRVVVSGWAAGMRPDYELMLTFYAPDVEVTADPEWEMIGRGGTFRGHPGKVEMVETFLEAWARYETVPELVVDLGGDRLLFLGTWHLVGHESGIEFESEVAQLVTLQRALIIREEWRFGWDGGLRAAGLDPEAIALPPRPGSP